MSDFLAEASEIQGDLVAIRRHIHQEPEIGLDLPKTQAKILAALDGLGLEITTGKALSSVTAVLRAGKSDKTVLLRADMDALPVTELADVSYKSQIDGAMHACGHDLHVAMLIGAAKLLVKNKSQLNGDVVFMFQPGEEGHDGAGHMIKEGVLTASGRKADRTYGIHVLSSAISSGVFTTKPGTMMASADEIHVTVVGMGGHGSQPHTAKDPIPVAAEMVSALQLWGTAMKSMTCNQLGGACEEVFSGETFDNVAAQSQQHGKEMFGANDGPHMAAMGQMMELMSAGEMDSWMAARKAEFDAL